MLNVSSTYYLVHCETGGKGKSPKQQRSGGSKRSESRVDTLIAKVLEKKLEALDKKGKDAPVDHIAKKVKLVKQFKTMTEALDGNKLLAAKVVPEFEVFLNATEKEEMKMLD